MKKYIVVFLFLLGCQNNPVDSSKKSEGRNPTAQGGQQNPTVHNASGLLASVANSTPYVNKIDSDEDFHSLSVPSKGLVSSGKAAKFVIDNRDFANPKIYFMNANLKVNGGTPEYVKFHMFFSQKFLNWMGTIDQYNNSTYFVNGVDKKKFIAGTIQSYLINQEGSSVPIYGVQFYPQDLISEQTVLHALKIVNENVTLAKPIAFIAYGSQQTISTVKNALQALGIANYTISDLLASQDSISMNEGEAWGYLRWNPNPNANLNYLEIPVFSEIPLDLSVVAGVITTQVQNPGSHINLKSKERGTPNIIVLNKEKVQELELLKDQPVYLKVLSSSYILEKIEGSNGKSADQIINEKNQKKLGNKWFLLKPIIPTNLTWFDDMCPLKESDCINASAKFGGKASKLGFLSHKNILGEKSSFVLKNKIPYRMTPYGFAVPLQFYVNFVKNNSELEKVLTSFIQDEKKGLLSPQQRTEKVAQIQKLFRYGKIPISDFQKTISLVKEMVANVQNKFGVTLKKFKVRSSANVEDMPGFDGAGLHSGYTARLKELEVDHNNCEEVAETEGSSGDVETKMDMNPPSLACTIKGVYASMWNQRAVEERSYRRIDHETSAMALAIHVNYNFQKEKGLVETANSVILTRVLNTDAVYGYSLNIQKGENLATNPDPGTTTEYSIATFLTAKEVPQFTLLQKAVPIKDQPELPGFVLDMPRMNLSVEIAKHLEFSYCKANKDYYKFGCANVYSDVAKSKSLDIEIKYLGDTELMVKQVREFAGH